MKDILRWFILTAIEMLEKIEYIGRDFDEDDPEKKVVDELGLSGTWVTSDTGLVKAAKIIKTQPYTLWRVKTSKHSIECADNHKLFDINFDEVFVRDLKEGELIMTESGLERIVSIEKTRHKVCMYDMEVAHPSHRYYTDGILSHNTVTSGIFIAWYICFQYDKNIMVLAHKMSTAREIVDKIRKVIQHLPFFLKPGCISSGSGGMKFDNGVNLYTQATTKSASLGYTIHLLYADEFAHIPEHIIVPFYRSIYPTLASSQVSRIIISSTANGMNLFHSLYDGAVHGTNSYTACRVDYWEVPGRDEAWKQREIANLDGNEELFNQEYGNQFIVGSKMLIDNDLASYMTRIGRDFKWKEVDGFESLPFSYESVTWDPKFDPNDIDTTHKYVFGIDIADGIGGDYTVVNMFRLESQSIAKIRIAREVESENSFYRLVQVGLFHCNTMSVEDFSRVLACLIFKVFGADNVRVVMETNFKGDLVYEKLSAYDDFYDDIFMHTRWSKNSRARKPGVKITGENKEMYCRELKKLLASRKIVIKDKETIKEINAFGINKNGHFEAQIGHDDIAMTLVNLVPYFTSDTFAEQVGDLYDSGDEHLKNCIQIKLDTADVQSTGDSETLEWLKAYM